jgi:hypothetical protein
MQILWEYERSGLGEIESGRVEVELRIAVAGAEMRRYFVYCPMTLH